MVFQKDDIVSINKFVGLEMLPHKLDPNPE